MITVHLGGALSKFSRKPIKLQAANVQQMMGLLTSMFGPTFEKMIREGKFQMTRGKKPKDVTARRDMISEEEIQFPFSGFDHIWFSPATKMAGRWGTIIVGIILIVVAWWNPLGWTGAAAMTGGAAAGTGTAGAVSMLGASMVLGGAMQMLTPKPSMGNIDQSGTNRTSMFNGVMTITEAGGAVPVPYGRINRAHTIILSAGMDSEAVPVETNQTS